MFLINQIQSIKYRISLKIRYYEIKPRLVAHLRYAFRNLFCEQHPLPRRLIISITSFPPRFPVLHLTLKTLLSQSIPPDLTILWLYQEDLLKLTPEVKRLIGKTFEVRTIANDIKSYKKLIPSIQVFPNDYIVTADDDTYYERNWLRDLVRAHKIGEKEVIGHRGHYMNVSSDGDILPYNSWQWGSDSEEKSPKIFLTGVGGILYPPGALPAEAVDDQIFMKICPKNDDVWFYFMAHKNGFMSKIINGDFRGCTWDNTQEVALFHTNVTGGANDNYIQKMVSLYGSPL